MIIEISLIVRDRPSDHECPRRVVQDLLTRFWLVDSSTKEEDLLDEMYWTIYGPFGKGGIDLEGSKPFYEENSFLCKAYALRILPTAGAKPLDTQSVISLFQWMVFCFRLHTLHIVLHSSLLIISEGCQDKDEEPWVLTEFTALILGFARSVVLVPPPPPPDAIELNMNLQHDIIGKNLPNGPYRTYSRGVLGVRSGQLDWESFASGNQRH